MNTVDYQISRTRGAREIERRGRRDMYIQFWWDSQKERDHLEDLVVCGRIMLKFIVEK
jgi:hypothetical protein